MPTFITVVRNHPTFNVEAYSLEAATKPLITDLVSGAARGARCRVEYSLHKRHDGFYRVATVILENMRRTEIDRALVLSEDPEVPRMVGHANSRATITCSSCLHHLFYYLDRSRDYEHHLCANCGHSAQTLTETGASA